MGDRSNIVMNYGNDREVWFYTHWRGSECPLLLKEALKLAQQERRLDDDGYLSRIIFGTLSKNAYSPTTGFGITPFKTDWEYPALVVHIEAQEIELRQLTHRDSERDTQIGRRISVAEYLTLPDDCDYDAVRALVAKEAA